MTSKKPQPKTAYPIAWDFRGWYSSPKDPQIEKDIQEAEKSFKAFAKKYKKTKDYLINDAVLYKALQDYEALSGTTNPAKPLDYLNLYSEADSLNTEVQSQLNLVSTRMSKAFQELYFFTLDIGTMPKADQKRILADKKFSHYRYFLKKIFETQQYQLTESEEKILSLKELTSNSMWVSAVEKTLSQKTVRVRGKDMTLYEASMTARELPTVLRRKVRDEVFARQKEMGDLAEAELNAIITDKKINDELRGFKKPYSSSVLASENNEKAIENLIESITERADIYKRYVTFKSKVLKEDILHPADVTAEIGSIKRTFTFDECVTILSDIYKELGDTYVAVFQDMLSNAQIDVYPRAGKRGGAFQHSPEKLPIMVFLNHTDSVSSLMTLAHEMGHAFHSHFAKKQGSLYEDYTLAIAEVASTFFEKLVLRKILPMLSPKEQVSLLHNHLADRLGLTVGVTARFNFEKELHERVRSAGLVTHAEMAEMHNKHFQYFEGKKVKRELLHGYDYVRISHYRRMFYNYQYSYGDLVSAVLVEKWSHDPSYLKKIEEFFEAGGSASPDDIFKSIGIDTTKKDFWHMGLSNLDAELTHLELLAKKAGLLT